MTAVSDCDALGAAELLLRVLDDAGADAPASLRPEQWESVERAALEHGLAPLLHRHLEARRGGGTAPPAAVACRLRDVHVHSVLRSTAVRAALAELLRTLRGAGVDVIVLKGACLAGDVYGETALRPMADVDLLVRREDLGRTSALLASIGYASASGAQAEGHHHLPAFVKPGAIPVEVHWSPARLGLAADAFGDVWNDAGPAVVAGVEVLVLRPEALLHHLCVHLAHGHRFWVPLLHLHDLAAVARRYPDLDWGRLEAIGRAHGSARFVYAALALAARAFPSRFSPGTRAHIARLAHDAEDDRVVALVWEALVAPTRDFPRLLARVEAAPDSLARARLLWRHLLPSRARMRLVAAPRPLAWAYLLRIGALLRRRWDTPLRFLLGTEGVHGVREQATRRAVVERWARGDAVP
jgi:hypothetical protein